MLNKVKSSQDSAVEIAFIPGKGLFPSSTSLHNGVQRATGNSSGRLKVHIRSPEMCAEEPAPVSSPSPDICPPDIHISAQHGEGSSEAFNPVREIKELPICVKPYLQATLITWGFYCSASQRSPTGAKPKITLDPYIRLKSDKLDLALSYLGLDVTEEKRKKLRQSLTIDPQGTVAYGDLVEATRNIFHENLEELGLGAGPFMFSYHEAASLMDTSAFHSPTYESECSYSSEEMEQFQTEVKQLQTQMKQLKVMLKDMEHSKKSLEEELQRTSEKACLTVEENALLKSRLQAAGAEAGAGAGVSGAGAGVSGAGAGVSGAGVAVAGAGAAGAGAAGAGQRLASSAEQDYEEVIQLLEAEIRDLKNQLANKRQARGLEATRSCGRCSSISVLQLFSGRTRQAASALIKRRLCVYFLRLSGLPPHYLWLIISDRKSSGCTLAYEEVLDLNRRLTTVDCQLRKSEQSRRHLNVHKVLTTPSLFDGGSNRSSPATDSPDTPSPLPDPAFQLAVEAKELVAGACSPPAEDNVSVSALEAALAPDVEPHHM
ncbi:hypothetical protein FQN60_004459 [Etheostoma spectabile]|uniref:Uncharacterized protein n=1 Tax=Etheostoma spectabile TaxID=54343 RepID=A0A5J5CZP2_9PERO|nr:hypothetical protein FQN60_004459 [Etheostoma spectabile]